MFTLRSVCNISYSQASAEVLCWITASPRECQMGVTCGNNNLPRTTPGLLTCSSLGSLPGKWQCWPEFSQPLLIILFQMLSCLEWMLSLLCVQPEFGWKLQLLQTVLQTIVKRQRAAAGRSAACAAGLEQQGWGSCSSICMDCVGSSLPHPTPSTGPCFLGIQWAPGCLGWEKQQHEHGKKQERFSWWVRKGNRVYLAINSSWVRLQWSSCCKAKGFGCWGAGEFNDDSVFWYVALLTWLC